MLCSWVHSQCFRITSPIPIQKCYVKCCYVVMSSLEVLLNH